MSCMIVYTLKTAEQPFASSLLGVHIRNIDVEEELQLSTDLRSTGLCLTNSSDPSNIYFAMPMCDPAFYACPPKPPTPPPRGRLPWPLPLKFQVLAETGHPAFQRRPDQAQTVQTSLPAASIDQLPLPPVTRTAACSCLERSEMTAASSSSVYSGSTSLSSLPSTVSSFNGNSRSSTSKNSASSRPTIPAIPERYLHKSHSLRNGGSPPRPGSRPAMPPAGFWMYARAAQQKQNDLEERSRPDFPEEALHLRARAQSESAASRDATFRRYSLFPVSPEKAVLRANMNRANTMRVAKKTSYENLRKGPQVAKVVEYGRLGGHRRKDSRTLVKMRQPWDEEPRWERNKAYR